MSTKTTKLGLPLIPEAEYDTKKVIDMIKENQGTATDSAFNKIDSFASDIDTRVAGKQEQLVSGQNIKTINGKSVLGTGDIEITVPNVPVEDVTVNGSSVVANKTAKITVPTKVSDLANDSKFITNSVDNLVNYYNKADVYTKTEIDNTLATFSKLKLTVVESLPSTGSSDTIYLVPAEQTVEQNYYNEYIWLSNKWELLGNTKIDLSDYYKKSEVDNKFATKTDVQAVDAKIPSLDGYATETYVNNHHDNTKVDKTDFKFKTVNNQEITGEGNISITVPDVPVEGVTVDGVSVVDNKIAKISLSGKQDVISDLADIRAGATLGKTALQAVPDEYAKKTDIPEVPTMVSAFTNDAGYLTEHQDISGKADKTYVDTELTKKQATLVSGTNIKTINNQSILGNGNITIEAAEQVQADWNETDESSKAYIKNKPTVPSGQIQADWNQADTAATDFIKNKPEIPDAVSVSKTGSATEEVQYITIGENEYKLPSGGSGGSVAFADITGEAIDNESLADALNGKQDLLPDAIGNNGKVLTVEDDQITWAPASGLPGYTDADVGKVLSIITSESEKVSPGVPLKLKDHYSKEELADFVQQYSLSEEVEVEVGVRGAASGQSFQLNVKSDNRGHYSVNYDYYSDLGRIECVYLFADELLAEWPEDGWYTLEASVKLDHPPEVVIPQWVVDQPDSYEYISDISELAPLFDLVKTEPSWNKEIAFEHTSESGTVSSSTTAGGFTATARSKKNDLRKDKLTTTTINDLGVQIAAIEEHDGGYLQTDLAISSDKIYYSKNGMTEDGEETHINVTESVEDLLVNWKEFIEASMAESSMTEFGECDTMTLDFTEDDTRKLGLLLAYLDIEED